VNTRWRYSANAVAFPSLLLAQLLSVFLMGFIDVWGRVSRFAAFHKVLSLGVRVVR
jgi:hypothetical protein